MDIINIKTNETDKKQKCKKITPFDIARAISTIIVFGIPLIAGATTIIGYGMYKIYKKLE